jgi:hypothetical protein
MQDEGEVEAHIELAKFYEWHEIELDKALAWTKQALTIVAQWPRGLRRDQIQADLNHRRDRLERKIGGEQG